MNFLRKAQTATEYLIIFAVVIVIALIVVGVMGGIPGIGGAGKTRASAAYWGSQDIAITDYAISAAGADTIIVKNNKQDSVTVTSVLVNSVEVATATTLGTGGTATFTGAIAACTAGQAFAYDVTIVYTDIATSAVYTITGAGNKLEGTCAA